MSIFAKSKEGEMSGLEQWKSRQMAAQLKAENDRNNRATRLRSNIAIIISLVSSLVSAAAIYFANFYRPEDLVVNAYVVERNQVGSGHLDVSIVFTNAGKQPVAVERVLLALNYGPSTTIESSSDWKIAGQVWMRNDRMFPDGTIISMQDGTYLTEFSPKTVHLNNESASPNDAFLVPANAATLMSVAFGPNPIDERTGPIVQMIGLQFYDKLGNMRQKIVPLGIAGNPPGLYNPVKNRVRLLP
jgi:hypothetical protein